MAQRRSAFLRDQDDVIDRIGIEHGLRHHNEENRSVDFKPPHFRFIVTRPSILLQDGPSSRKLAASKSVCFCRIRACVAAHSVQHCLHSHHTCSFSITIPVPTATGSIPSLSY